MNVLETLKTIKPGENYPVQVTISEPDLNIIQFTLNSFFVGMYCEVKLNGRIIDQLGDYDNKKFVTGLKKDIKKAIARGAKIEFGPIRPCKLVI